MFGSASENKGLAHALVIHAKGPVHNMSITIVLNHSISQAIIQSVNQQINQSLIQQHMKLGILTQQKCDTYV